MGHRSNSGGQLATECGGGGSDGIEQGGDATVSGPQFKTVPAISRFLVPGELEKEADALYVQASDFMGQDAFIQAYTTKRKNYTDSDGKKKKRRIAKRAYTYTEIKRSRTAFLTFAFQLIDTATGEVIENGIESTSLGIGMIAPELVDPGAVEQWLCRERGVTLSRQVGDSTGDTQNMAAQ